VFLNGQAIPTRDERGRLVVDDSFYVMVNAHHEPLEFVMPEAKWGERWTIVLDTNEASDHVTLDDTGRVLTAGEKLNVQAWSTVVLRHIAS
jgi:glycogen operon protein